MVDPNESNSLDFFEISLWIAASATGAPSAAGHTVAVGTGTILQTVTANALYRVITDGAGKAMITLTAGAPPISRFVRAVVVRTVQTRGLTVT